MFSLKNIKAIKTFGNSMLPMLQDGDIVEIKKTNYARLKVEDIIIFKKGNKYSTHRIIYKSNSYVITKGDNNKLSDGKIYPKQIIGNVSSIKRQGEVINIESYYLLQSSIYFLELTKLIFALKKENIPYVVLKGLPIHLFYEHQHPRKLYADCDILIKRQNYPKLKKIFTKLGYISDNSSLLHKDKSTLPEISFYKVIHRTPIVVIFDIHFEVVFMLTQINNLKFLYPPRLLEKLTNQMLKQKIQITIQNEEFFILNEENLILYLCLHLFHHNFTGYYRYKLLHKILSRKNINFNKLLQLTLEYKLENFILPTLLILKKNYNTFIPNSFIKQLESHSSKANYIDKDLIKVNIFDDESQIQAGIKRFKLIFFLSPNSFFYKLLTFTDYQILRLIFYSFSKSIKIKLVK